MQRLFFSLILIILIGCGNKSPVNIYESEGYKNLSANDIKIGESIWASTCFRCHMYGSMGAVSVNDKKHFDELAAKGFEQLSKRVTDGMEGARGVMPPKGSCYSCSKVELEKAVYYIFHLAQKAHEIEITKNVSNEK